MLGASLNKAFDHPQTNLQFPWQCTQWGLLVFPLSPFLGAVAIVLASLVTWSRQHQTIIRRPLNWGFALVSALLIVTTGFADDKVAAFLGLFNLLPYFFVYTGLSALIQTTAQLRQIAYILVIGSVPVVIFGWGQLFLGWNFDFKFLWIVLEWAIAPGGNPSGRMASILMHANTLAAYLVIVFILALGLWLEKYRQLKQTRLIAQNKQLSTLPFIFLTIALLGNFIALILTNSRNGWAIAIFACLAYALYQGWRLIVGAVVVIVASILSAAFAPSPVAQFFRRFIPAFFWARLNDDMYPDRPLALMRKTQWEFAWSLTQQHPWTGWGLRSFSKLYQAKMQISLGHPHNIFLMLAAETGIPTTLLFCALLIWILIAGIQLLVHSNYLNPEQRLIFFSYLTVGIGCVLLNTVDVTLFDLRLNTFFWVIFSAISGATYHYHRHEKLIAKQN
ncbi:O-antigen ligase family protein [Fortiea contorta]|uniref:O-antigen ligase family protein n=1 Tax=Fortiea contorta TaxID=1892405 RepID=UPI00034A66A0|nr:O-antigen ligase family protein [Fortiea contorta]